MPSSSNRAAVSRRLDGVGGLFGGYEACCRFLIVRFRGLPCGRSLQAEAQEGGWGVGPWACAGATAVFRPPVVLSDADLQGDGGWCGGQFGTLSSVLEEES